MAAARLVALQRVAAHQLGELEEVGDPSGVLERLVDQEDPAEQQRDAKPPEE